MAFEEGRCVMQLGLGLKHIMQSLSESILLINARMLNYQFSDSIKLTYFATFICVICDHYTCSMSRCSVYIRKTY